MIDIENHKIVDIIESRKDSDVAAWLKTFPNLELVSRDGALCYKNAINDTNKDIVQVTDRFHLLKNLTNYCRDYLLKNFNKFIYLNKNEEQLKEIEIYEKYKLFIDKKIIGKSKKIICKNLEITSNLYEQFENKYLEEKSKYKITLEPCTMCAGALAWAQIGKIVYGAQDQKRGYSILAPSVLHPKTNVVSGVLQEECAQLIKDFFASKR